MKTVIPGLSEHEMSIESKFNFCRIFLKNLLPLSSSGIPREPRRAVNTIAMVNGMSHRNRVVNELELVVRARANSQKNRGMHARDFSDKAIKIIQNYNHLKKEETVSSIEALLSNMKAAINEDVITDSSDEVMEKRRIEFLNKCPPEIHHLYKQIKMYVSRTFEISPTYLLDFVKNCMHSSPSTQLLYIEPIKISKQF